MANHEAGFSVLPTEPMMHRSTLVFFPSEQAVFIPSVCGRGAIFVHHRSERSVSWWRKLLILLPSLLEEDQCTQGRQQDLLATFSVNFLITYYVNTTPPPHHYTMTTAVVKPILACTWQHLSLLLMADRFALVRSPRRSAQTARRAFSF